MEFFNVSDVCLNSPPEDGDRIQSPKRYVRIQINYIKMVPTVTWTTLNWLKIIFTYEPFCDGDEFSVKRDEATGVWRKLYNDQIKEDEMGRTYAWEIHTTKFWYEHVKERYHKRILTYLLGFLRSWALLEEPPIVQPLKNFPASYGTRSFNTVFTRAFHWSLSWAISIQSTPSYPISLRSILILSTHLRLGLPSGLFRVKRTAKLKLKRCMISESSLALITINNNKSNHNCKYTWIGIIYFS
jgi:hypothetical protein